MRLRLPAILLALLPLSAAAQSLSLAETEALWRENSREVALARAAVAGAEADVITAGQIPNPDFSLNVSQVSPQSGVGSGPLKDKRMDSVFLISQLVERGDKRDLRVRGAEARLEASRSDVAGTERQQLAALRAAYYDLRLAQETLRLNRETVGLYSRSAEAGRLRQKAGDIAPVDVARLQIDRDRAEAEARQAQSGLEQAQQRLGYLIGRQGEAGSLVAGDGWPLLDNADPVTPAIEGLPDIAASRQRAAAAEADRDLARARRTRDVTVGVQYERNMWSDPNNSLGVGVSVPIFLWHGHEGEIARAESDFDIARRQYDQLLARTREQVAQARSALLAARDRARRLEDGLLADARRVALAAEFAYGKGAMGLMDLLDARRTLRQIEIEAAGARASYAKARSDWELLGEYGKGK
jgi:cobalt-zinc-cadmium efflux system outer membrane protein